MSLKSTKQTNKKLQTKAKQKIVYSFLEVEAGGTEAPGHPQFREKTQKPHHSTEQNSRESEPLSYMWSPVHGSIHRVWGLRDLTATSVWEGPVWDRGESHLCG